MGGKACRDCNYVTTETTCPNCKSTSFSDDYSGIVIIFDPETSAIAKAMKATKKGKYALRVR
ncbi:MAG TPA: transcription elongation factor subunit Spt4 [Candidatus Bathyarchaeia archaeon]|nr:transcription elongation factor subunit Spt4 [Candidatus Bathyarchaeia archaeon]